MGKSTPKAPAAPDPAATASAQTESNQKTALYNFGLNNPTYNTPLGGISYSVDTSDPNQPKSTANVTLSPGQQQLYDNQTQQSIGLSNLATQLQGRVGSTLDQALPSQTDINTLSKNAQDAYYANQTRFLDPQFQNNQNQLDSKLANQGVVQGSEAYRNAQDDLGRQKLQAYDQAQNNAILQGPQNAQANYALTAEQRAQPLNELNALRTGSQVSMPQVPGMNTSNAAGTNTAGIAQQGYQNSLNGYNQQVASQNQTQNNLYGLGGAGIMAAFSDRRLKTNIERIGETKGGVPVYRYKYKGSDHIHMGVMADEVKHIDGAVIRMASGYDAVDYSKLR